MLYEEFIEDSITLFLNHSSKNSEIDVLYDKSFQLKRKMECALIDINIPQIFSKGSNEDYNIEFIFVYPQLPTDFAVLDQKTNYDPNLHIIKNKKYTFDINQKDKNQIERNFTEIVKDANNLAKEIIESRFDNMIYGVFNRKIHHAFLYKMFFECNLFYNKLSNSYEHVIGRVLKVGLNSAPRATERVVTPDSLKVVAYFYLKLSDSLRKLLKFSENYIPNENIITKIEPQYFREPGIIHFNPAARLDIFNRGEETEMLCLYKSEYLYVYCNIIKDSYINNIKDNILRIFRIDDNNFDKSNWYNFKNLIFIPLRVDEFDLIKLSIRNESGQLINFSNNEYFATLLIRPLEQI